MEKKNYTQCILKKDGNTRIEWIEQKYAVKGNRVQIKENDTWEVTSLGGTVDDETLLKILHIGYLNVKEIE